MKRKGQLLLLALLAGSPGMASAGAFDQLRSMAGGSGNIPPVGNPECVSGCEGSGTQGSDGGNDEGGSGVFGWIDYWQEQQQIQQQQQQQKQQQEEKQRKQAAFQLNEQGNRAYEGRNWASAVELYRKALEKSPHDKVIQQNLRNAERELARQEELRKEQSAYRQRMQQLLAVMPVSRPLASSIQAGGARTKVPLPGFSPQQWDAYLAAQETADRLYAKRNREGALSDEEAAAFFAALRRRNELWAEATQQPLADDEREALRLALPRVVSKRLLDLSSVMQMLQQDNKAGEAAAPFAADRRQNAEAARQAPSADAISNALVADFSADKATKLLETETGEAIEAARGEKYKARYERLLGFGRVAVKAWQGGPPAAGAETADLLVAQMPEPMGARAEMAVEGGRLYSKVAYQALNRFMVDAMQATGSSFDPEAFWKNFNAQLGESQKGIRTWVQFGE